MKTTFLKVGMLTVLSCSLVLTSCSKDDDSTNDEETTTVNLTAEQSKQTAETDVATDGLFNIIDLAYGEQEAGAGNLVSFFPNCVTITISMQNGVKFVALDFGQGCTLPNGNTVAGKIYLTYGPPVADTVTITYRLENFVRNNKQIKGEGSLFRERSNAQGNPQHTVNHELEITFPNGLVVEANGTRESEWIEGFGSGVWNDNVFSITGNRDLEFSTGFSHNAEVIDALRREVSCDYFVSGTVALTRDNGTGELDYGDGTCDNIAILTVNGIEYTIVLD